jgi:hypothetical protein
MRLQDLKKDGEAQVFREWKAILYKIGSMRFKVDCSGSRSRGKKWGPTVGKYERTSVQADVAIASSVQNERTALRN